MTPEDKVLAACDWADYRRDYGVSNNEHVRSLEHKAFLAGWTRGRYGEASDAVQR